MATPVLIDSGPVSADTSDFDHLPRGKWPELVSARKYFLAVKLSYDCRCLVRFVGDAEHHWKTLGYKNLEDMIVRGYGLDGGEVQIAVNWLKLREPAEPISLPRVLELNNRGNPNPHDKQGRFTKGVSNTNGSNTTIGRGKDYLLARLDRDGKTEPQKKLLAAKVRSNEISANQAAIEASFRNSTVAVRFLGTKERLDPEYAARTLRQYFKGDNLQLLIRYLRE